MRINDNVDEVSTYSGEIDGGGIFKEERA